MTMFGDYFRTSSRSLRIRAFLGGLPRGRLVFTDSGSVIYLLVRKVHSPRRTIGSARMLLSYISKHIVNILYYTSQHPWHWGRMPLNLVLHSSGHYYLRLTNLRQSGRSLAGTVQLHLNPGLRSRAFDSQFLMYTVLRGPVRLLRSRGGCYPS